MIVVFPSDEAEGLNSRRGAHFGRANWYISVQIEDGHIQETKNVQNPGHTTGGCGNAVENIRAMGADALVVVGIGPRPLQGFAEIGINVLHDAKNVTVKESIEAFLRNDLQAMTAEQSCSHNQA